MKAETEAGPSSQEAPAGPWDTTFNRAMNVYKGRDKSKAPTSAGRVTGCGAAKMGSPPMPLNLDRWI